ncbi:MAG: cell division protein FtsQ/DivIB, partial [Candidatus Eiseniibacteriota bacterium]
AGRRAGRPRPGRRGTVSASYQGRALRSENAPRPRRGLRVLARVLVVLAVLVAIAHLPWDARLRPWAVVKHIRVEGVHYLDADHVIHTSGLATGQDLFKMDFARARQALLLEPRIAEVRFTHDWPRGLDIQVTERTPVMLVQHGIPWEIDSAGVLLPPLADGVEADVPMIAGPHFDHWPAGTRVRTAEVDRALAWVRTLSDRDLQLGAQLSEVDASDPDLTVLTLLSGTRVLSPAWPLDLHQLAALRVALADLHRRGEAAREIDIRFEGQIVVRPNSEPPAGASGARTG